MSNRTVAKSKHLFDSRSATIGEHLQKKKKKKRTLFLMLVYPRLSVLRVFIFDWLLSGVRALALSEQLNVDYTMNRT